MVDPTFSALLRAAARFSDAPGGEDWQRADFEALRAAVGAARLHVDRWPADARLLFDECERIVRAKRTVSAFSLRMAGLAVWDAPAQRPAGHLKVVK